MESKIKNNRNKRCSKRQKKEKETKKEQEDPVPLTDEEFAEFQKKERRKAGIIGVIVDLILDFFR